MSEWKNLPSNCLSLLLLQVNCWMVMLMKPKHVDACFFFFFFPTQAVFTMDSCLPSRGMLTCLLGSYCVCGSVTRHPFISCCIASKANYRPFPCNCCFILVLRKWNLVHIITLSVWWMCNMCWCGATINQNLWLLTFGTKCVSELVQQLRQWMGHGGYVV